MGERVWERGNERKRNRQIECKLKDNRVRESQKERGRHRETEKQDNK